MEQQAVRQVPYGVSDFARVMTQIERMEEV